MQEKTENTYKQIIKATSIFGGVQVVTILTQIIRSKIIAIILGPSGMGIVGLITTTISLLTSLTNFGLSTSAIRDVSQANKDGNIEEVTLIIKVLRRLIWFTGLSGVLLMLICAPLLSQYAFGNSNYISAFRILSLSLLFNQLTSGQIVVLQGLRKLEQMAKANVYGSIFGLLISVPLYYFFLFDAIVPAILVTSIVAMFFSHFFSNKIKLNNNLPTIKQTIETGKSMLGAGFFLSLSAVVFLGGSFIIRAYIGKVGSIEDVGLYSAGFAIIGSYVSLIFTAMHTDYYPRLSAVTSDIKMTNSLINQQGETILLIIGPILSFFLIFANAAIVLFYSSEFSPINRMIEWAALGMYFKAISSTIVYVFLAKGATNLFFVNELISHSTLLVLNIVGYELFGLEGLGIAFFISYVLHIFQVFIFSKKLYLFKFEKKLCILFIIQFSIGILCFLCKTFLCKPFSFIVGIVLIIFSVLYSFFELNKRTNMFTGFWRKK